MLKGRRYSPKSVRDSDATDELIGLLNAISVVAKRLATKLALLRDGERK